MRIWIVIIFWVIGLGHCLYCQHNVATGGVLDLRGWDWVENPAVDAAGQWKFQWGAHYDQPAMAAQAPRWTQVPAPWEERFGFGTYHLKVLLDSVTPFPLALQVDEFLTAFELQLNGRRQLGNGRVGTERSQTTPEFKSRYVLLPRGVTELEVLIRGANFHHRQGGMVQAPVIGTVRALLDRKEQRMIFGGILIGLMLMSSAYQFMLYGHRKQGLATLLHGFWSLAAAFHFLCLNERWLYTLMGPGAWEWVYKFELFTLFLVFGLGIAFLWHFFERRFNRWVYWGMMGILGIQALYILVTPVWLAALVDRVIPIDIVLLLAYILGAQAISLRRKLEGAVPLAVTTLALVVALLMDNFLFGRHVGNLLPVHYFTSAFVLSLSWILSRRFAHAQRRVTQLTSQLEQQNRRLELEVQKRTAELVETQSRAYKLELEQKRRDLEVLNANNQMKVQLTKNLVAELQKLLSTEGDYQTALRSLIVGLKGQMATEEKLQVLQNDLEVVNAEFFTRLQAKYPQLSKTEREICAYFKLNLSSKDIAALRKTSLNTINVSRHRIRKKLGLERDEELEAFIQQL